MRNKENSMHKSVYNINGLGEGGGARVWALRYNSRGRVFDSTWT